MIAANELYLWANHVEVWHLYRRDGFSGEARAVCGQRFHKLVRQQGFKPPEGLRPCRQCLLHADRVHVGPVVQARYARLLARADRL